MINKLRLLQISIIAILLIIIVSALVFSAINEETISEHKADGTGNRLVSWNLKSGLKVTGSFQYSIKLDSSFRIIREGNGEIYTSSITNGHGNFSFTANENGLYVLYGPSITKNNQLDYTYTTNAPIFGLDLTIFISLTIVLGAIMELIVLLSSRFFAKTHSDK